MPNREKAFSRCALAAGIVTGTIATGLAAILAASPMRFDAKSAERAQQQAAYRGGLATLNERNKSLLTQLARECSGKIMYADWNAIYVVNVRHISVPSRVYELNVPGRISHFDLDEEDNHADVALVLQKGYGRNSDRARYKLACVELSSNRVTAETAEIFGVPLALRRNSGRIYFEDGNGWKSADAATLSDMRTEPAAPSLEEHSLFCPHDGKHGHIITKNAAIYASDDALPPAKVEFFAEWMDDARWTK